MAIQFILGPARAGKSKYVQKLLIDEDISGSERKLLLIVPDQFTMQTQKEMVLMHPDRAFSNIEVLSFSRLSHRIMEEVGGEEIPVLDDTGKSLIIRHVAENVSSQLKVMGTKLHRYGFVHEVKSAISEFMQYGINPDSLHKYSENITGRTALATKLQDLELIYRAFLQYKSDNFLTKEETLDITRKSLHKSNIVKNSIIVFDGFTGFTPIQERVIQELMVVADRVMFSFTMEEGLNPYDDIEEQNIFWLTSRSVKRLKKYADQASVTELDPVYIQRIAEKANTENELTHLEKNLFRYPYSVINHEPEHIKIYNAGNIREEITDTCQRIVSFTRDKGLMYRDISVVAGDLSAYADDIAEISAEFGLPVYMDYSRSVMQSPFIEAIRSAFDVVDNDYSQESIMRYFRCGFGSLSREECDELENFLLRTGIRGRSAYAKVWTVNYTGAGPESDYHRDKRIASMERLNHIREEILTHFASLHNNEKTNGNCNVTEMSRGLFEFMSQAKMETRLMSMADAFEQKGDVSRFMEYKQIYGRVIDLLDQIVSLIGDETITLKEYREILEAGFGEIKLGVIPQQTDTIKVGDLVRTRIPETKVLFILGANDCNIPGAVSGGGIISDLDREYIRHNTEMELAPTPREQMFTQRLYLYMNMTKPSEELILSYAQMDVQGKSMQPSYLINTLMKLFPALKCQKSNSTHAIEGMEVPAGAHLSHLAYAEMLRDFAGDRLDKDNRERLTVLGEILDTHGDSGLATRIKGSAFAHYKSTPLSKDIAEKLYGDNFSASVSRIEKYASCAYAHFLTYGMSLKERSEYGFESRNLGDVYHKCLELFSLKLQEEGISWADFTPEVSHAWIDEIMNDIAMTYGETILISNNRTLATTRRITRILKRTVDTIQYQVAKGDFVPSRFEQGFVDKKTINLTDGKTVNMKVIGKIDRVDVCEKNGQKLVRIVDYKSGNKDFDVEALYHGLMLQLAVYMKEAMSMVKNGVPAGMLYYHISDPVINSDIEIEDLDVAGALRGELTMKGVVNADMTTLAAMDRELGAGASVVSDVIPVGFNKNGSFKSNASVLGQADLEAVLDFADKKMEQLTKEILEGNKDPHPCTVDAKVKPCKYCPHATICPIDSGATGYSVCVYPKTDISDILAEMKKQEDDEA